MFNVIGDVLEYLCRLFLLAVLVGLYLHLRGKL